MAFRTVKLSALRVSDPVKWEEKLLAVYGRHRSNAAAAEELDISISTLIRWIQSLRKEGSPVPRRPRSAAKWLDFQHDTQDVASHVAARPKKATRKKGK